jgi:hypothetical protein
MSPRVRWVKRPIKNGRTVNEYFEIDGKTVAWVRQRETGNYVAYAGNYAVAFATAHEGRQWVVQTLKAIAALIMAYEESDNEP